jgi:hypothetical protein
MFLKFIANLMLLGGITLSLGLGFLTGEIVIALGLAFSGIIIGVVLHALADIVDHLSDISAKISK